MQVDKFCAIQMKVENGLDVEFFLQREAVCIVHIYISFGIKVRFQYQGKNEKFSRSHVRTATEHILWIGANVEVQFRSFFFKGRWSEWSTFTFISE